MGKFTFYLRQKLTHFCTCKFLKKSLSGSLSTYSTMDKLKQKLETTWTCNHYSIEKFFTADFDHLNTSKIFLQCIQQSFYAAKSFNRQFQGEIH